MPKKCHLKRRKYHYNQKKYNDFLLHSELFETLSTQMFVQEPLARALLSILSRDGIVNYQEVCQEFNNILWYGLTKGTKRLDGTENEEIKDSVLIDFLNDIMKTPPKPLTPLIFPPHKGEK